MCVRGVSNNTKVLTFMSLALYRLLITQNDVDCVYTPDLVRFAMLLPVLPTVP